MKKDVGVGIFVQSLYALSLHLHVVSVVFGTAISTSLYLLENVLFTCLH